jgi:hypothetical protein
MSAKHWLPRLTRRHKQKLSRVVPYRRRPMWEVLEDRRLLAISVNDNWHFVADNDLSSSLTNGDTVRNDNDIFNPATITATYGTDGFGTVISGAFTGTVAGSAAINDAIANASMGETVTVLEGAYAEAVTVNVSGLTLTGGTGTATDVVIDPPSGNGITASQRRHDRGPARYRCGYWHQRYGRVRSHARQRAVGHEHRRWSKPQHSDGNHDADRRSRQ